VANVNPPGLDSVSVRAAAPVCDIGELLSAYLDGELREGELDTVVSHLAECLGCIAEFHAMKEARTAVRMMPMLQVPDRVIPAAHYGLELSAFLDGELTPDEQVMLVNHLQGCSECLLELQDLDSARTAVRALPGVEPPVPLIPRLPVRSQRKSIKRFAVAAAALFGASFLAFNMMTSGPQQTSVNLDSLADRHTVRHSVETGFNAVPAFAPGLSP